MSCVNFKTIRRSKPVALKPTEIIIVPKTKNSVESAKRPIASSNDAICSGACNTTSKNPTISIGNALVVRAIVPQSTKANAFFPSGDNPSGAGKHAITIYRATSAIKIIPRFFNVVIVFTSFIAD